MLIIGYLKRNFVRTTVMLLRHIFKKNNLISVEYFSKLRNFMFLNRIAVMSILTQNFIVLHAVTTNYI